MTLRRASWGVVVIAGYLVVAALTFQLANVPIRPLFDGNHGGPLPYRWVDPPPEEEPFNLPPEMGGGIVRLTAKGSRDADFATTDLQARVVFTPRAFELREGERRIEVTITPIDPDTVGAPPAGSEYQGNAYTITAGYAGSGKRAPTTARDCDLQKEPYLCSTVLLRTPFGAIDIARWSGQEWQPLPDSLETGGDIFADSASLGTFVALAEEGRIAASIAARAQAPSSGTPLRDIIAIVLGAVAVIVTSAVYRTRVSHRRREEAKRRAAGKRYKAPERKGRRAPARKQ